MNVKFPCPIKTALLIAYQNATRLYADSARKLGKEIGIVSRDQYESLRITSDKEHRFSVQALEAFDAHTHEHGC